ncbi:MAG TPA: class I SAM-dependent methyltransferase [Solirubrobacterales bacterium]|nr:class I SAM-dependent methyltransferase [Solirubrobacterales bacterium]
MRQQTRSRVANCLDRAHLLRPAERLRQSWLTIRAHEDHLAFDGLPVPPARLRLLVDGRSGDAAHFLGVGRQMFESIGDAVAAAGTDPGELRSVLDFGCGCGRVARHWARLEGPEIYGCDYNPELTGWCERNLPFLRVARNRLEPPTPYVTGSFDLVYALSVFSHLDDPLQRRWLEEYRRLLRPGGLLVLSLLGDSLRYRLDAAERRRYDRGELVVQRPRLAGRNLCTVYHPPAYVSRSLLAGFSEVRGFELGSPAQPMQQDAYIARR